MFVFFVVVSNIVRMVARKSPNSLLYCLLFLRVGGRWVWRQQTRNSTEKERFLLYWYRAFEEQWTSRFKLCGERVSSSGRLQTYSNDFLWGGILLIVCQFVYTFSCLLRSTLNNIRFLASLCMICLSGDGPELGRLAGQSSVRAWCLALLLLSVPFIHFGSSWGYILIA